MAITNGIAYTGNRAMVYDDNQNGGKKEKPAVQQAPVTAAEEEKKTTPVYVQQAAATTASTPNYDRTVPAGTTVDPALQAQYQNAMAALEQKKNGTPTYDNRYDADIQSLYQQITGRGPFQYDSKTDPLYQQYVQDYTTQGKMAMRDTMGRAAALTGGYGSSYAQSVGQQQYDQYLQRMADILPETYGMALDAYNAEGNRLQQNLSTATALEQSDYGKYLDALNQHNIDMDRAQSDADTWYNRMTAAEKENYNRQQDAYSRLVSLMSTGYKPTKEEYNSVGLSEAQGEAIRGAYMPAPVTTVVYRDSKNNSSNTGNMSAYQMGVNLAGKITAKDLKKNQYYQNLTAEQKRQIYQGLVDSQKLSMFDK